MDKYANPDEIKRRLIINSHYSNSLFIKELSELGLNIQMDRFLISKLFLYYDKDLDESSQNIRNTLKQISNKDLKNLNSKNTNLNSNSSGNISNLINLITKKIQVDTKN